MELATRISDACTPEVIKQKYQTQRAVDRYSSYFKGSNSNVATDALKYYYKKHIKRNAIKDRIPINPRVFVKDVRDSGMQIVKWIVPRPLTSMQWYVVLRAI